MSDKVSFDEAFGETRKQKQRGLVSRFFHYLVGGGWKRHIAVLVGVLVFLCVLVFGTLIGLYNWPNQFGSTQEEVIIVNKGETGAEIGDVLYEKGLIRSPWLFRLALRLTGTMDKLQSGYYQIPYKSSLHDVISLLQQGRLKVIKVTIPEGYTIQQIADLLQHDGLVNKAAFLKEAKTYVPYQYMYGPEKVDYRMEGFLFPSTYEIPVNSTPKEILHMMAAEMNQQITPAMRAELKKKHMTIFEFITLASLVEKEAKFDEDRPLIAAVFLKRLALGMPLQEDSGIQYILGRPSANVSITDTKINNPYNTYTHKGLPPGPIANPGLKSMEAVLNAPKTDYLFFVAEKDGHHKFTKTYEEHMKAVASIYGHN